MKKKIELSWYFVVILFLNHQMTIYCNIYYLLEILFKIYSHLLKGKWHYIILYFYLYLLRLFSILNFFFLDLFCYWIENNYFSVIVIKVISEDKNSFFYNIFWVYFYIYFLFKVYLNWLLNYFKVNLDEIFFVLVP